MTCAQLRECLFAFLDNELDGPLSIEVQRHLEHCPSCAREAEIERTIRHRLEGVLSALDSIEESDQASLEGTVRRITSIQGRQSRPRRPLLVSATVAAGIMVLAVGYVQLRQLAYGTNDRVAQMLVQDFQHFLEKGRPIQLASTEPAALSAWLREATGLSVSLPALPETQGQLIGARKCRLAGRSAAFALYEMNGTPASLIVMPGAGLDLDAMKQVRDGPHLHWIDRQDGHTVLACRRGELLYAAVSTLGEDRLALLMTHDAPRE